MAAVPKPSIARSWRAPRVVRASGISRKHWVQSRESGKTTISFAWRTALRLGVYLVDTDVISELSKKEKANIGMVTYPENPLDNQIAATALVYDLTVVTRNVRHFAETGVKLLNPFSD